MALSNSSELIAQGGDVMAIHMDGMDYYYNETNGNSCWGGGQTTSYGYYEPSNMYMLNNATQIKQDLTAKGWSFNAIMAVLGNMSYESYINPAQSEIGKALDGTYGYGLCQWTPCGTTIKRWLTNNGYPLTSGYYQLDYLDADPDGKWDSNKAPYNMTFNQFKHSTLGVDYLTQAFLDCYEKGKPHQYRYYCAHWYEQYFGGALTGYPIYVTSEGNGTAYASPDRVEVGDYFFIYAYPNGTDEIVSITGEAEDGSPIAMAQYSGERYTYNAIYGNYIRVHVVFTGSTPPIPPRTYLEKKRMPIWMYPKFRK